MDDKEILEISNHIKFGNYAFIQIVPSAYSSLMEVMFITILMLYLEITGPHFILKRMNPPVLT